MHKTCAHSPSYSTTDAQCHFQNEKKKSAVFLFLSVRMHLAALEMHMSYTAEKNMKCMGNDLSMYGGRARCSFFSEPIRRRRRITLRQLCSLFLYISDLELPTLAYICLLWCFIGAMDCIVSVVCTSIFESCIVGRFAFVKAANACVCI